MLDAIYLAGLAPERDGQPDELQHTGAHHDVVEVPPGQVGAGNHAGGDEGREQRPDRVAAVHDPLDRVGVLHDADPGAERGVREPVAEAGDGVDDDKRGERRVGGQNGVGQDVAERRGDGDPPLSEARVDHGVGEGGDGVAGERGQEDQGHDGVVEVVVVLEGGDEGLDRGVSGFGLELVSQEGNVLRRRRRSCQR